MNILDKILTKTIFRPAKKPSRFNLFKNFEGDGLYEKVYNDYAKKK